MENMAYLVMLMMMTLCLSSRIIKKSSTGGNCSIFLAVVNPTFYAYGWVWYVAKRIQFWKGLKSSDPFHFTTRNSRNRHQRKGDTTAYPHISAKLPYPHVSAKSWGKSLQRKIQPTNSNKKVHSQSTHLKIELIHTY